MCVDWVRDLQFRDLVDEVKVVERPLRSTFIEKFRAIERTSCQLRNLGPWDLAFSLPNSISAAWLSYRSGAKRRRGYRADGRGLLLNEGLPWDGSPDRHRAQAYVDLLPFPGKEGRLATSMSRPDIRDFWAKPPENDLDPVTPGVLTTFNPAKSWPSALPVEPPEGNYWVLAPGATAESRRWSPENFARLAVRIQDELGLSGVIVGGPKEAPLAEQIIDMVRDINRGNNRELKRGGIQDFTALGPVCGLWKIFQNAKFTVCNESGLAHVASLCGSFVQIVCGAADPRRTRPIGPGKVQVAINPLDCWPCERNSCDQTGSQKFQCLLGIQPDSVWGEIKRGLRIDSGK